jgi:hypothetical protein
MPPHEPDAVTGRTPRRRGTPPSRVGLVFAGPADGRGARQQVWMEPRRSPVRRHPQAAVGITRPPVLDLGVVLQALRIGCVDVQGMPTAAAELGSRSGGLQTDAGLRPTATGVGGSPDAGGFARRIENAGTMRIDDDLDYTHTAREGGGCWRGPPRSRCRRSWARRNGGRGCAWRRARAWVSVRHRSPVVRREIRDEPIQPVHDRERLADAPSLRFLVYLARRLLTPRPRASTPVGTPGRGSFRCRR